MLTGSVGYQVHEKPEAVLSNLKRDSAQAARNADVMDKKTSKLVTLHTLLGDQEGVSSTLFILPMLL